MTGEQLIAALKKKFGVTTNRDLAKRLGVSGVNIGTWARSGRELSGAQVANLVRSAMTAEVSASQREAIKPIVEYFPLEAVESRGGVKYELFPAGKDDNPLHVGLRQALQLANGIYIFYDSRGRALYAGKAKRQSLWAEMKCAFNRAERKTQKVYRVAHPERRQNFVPGYEKARQPFKIQLDLSDLAAYFSAYEVLPGMIDELEALLVRGFANDLLNIRMERFESLRKRP